MPDLADIPGLLALRDRTPGDPRIKIAVLDGPIEIDRACFQGANLTRLAPYWAEEFEIDPQDLKAFLTIENSNKSDKQKEERLSAAIPDKTVLSSLYLRFHANHVSSILCGQPDSPVEGIAPRVTILSIPLAYSHETFLNPLNLSRAISLAIEQGADIIHCAACHPTQNGLASEVIDKAIHQAQANNILIVAPGSNDKGERWCTPAVLENVLAVEAMKDTGKPFKAFSDVGSHFSHQSANPGILAPGETILGAQVGTDEPIRKHGNGYAAPIVTGVAALLMSLQLARGASPDAEAVRAALTNSVIPCNPDEVKEPERCLLGRLNIPGAYELLTGEPLDAGVASNPVDGDEVELAGSAVVVPIRREGTVAASDETFVDVQGGAAPVAISAMATMPAAIAPIPAIPASAVTPQNAAIAAKNDPNHNPHTVAYSAVSSPERIGGVTASRVTTSSATANNIAVSRRSNLVYALGTLGYDFGTEARRDSFKQLMPAVTIGATQVPANPYDARQMVEYLETNLWEAKSLIWTLNLELTPVYAIEPVGAFATDIYELMQYMLAGQVLSEDDEDYIERVSIPGHLSQKTVKLFSGQVVPVLNVNSPRCMYGWKVNTLVESALAAVAAEQDSADETVMRRSLSSFLNRVYYDLRNLGQMARDRALNFAATNAFQAVQTFSEAIALGMELDSITVEKSPFCRYGSECWDVKLKFFDPENHHRARKVFRFTLDVLDAVPVTLGEVRSWSVST